MITYYELSPFVKFEKVLDFSKETDIIAFQGYYMKTDEITTNRRISLYVMEMEEVTKIYQLSVSSSDWVRDNLEYDIKEKITKLPEEFMYKFDLIRVIPENGCKHLDSFLRVMLKQVPENAKLYSIEEEMYGKNYKPFDFKSKS